MIDFLLTVQLDNLVWQSDWNGYEVGYPEVDVVGLYSASEPSEWDGRIYNYYIDGADNQLLAFWADPEDEEDM